MKTQRVITIRFMGDEPSREFAVDTSTRPSSSDGVLAAVDIKGECHYFPMVNVKEWFLHNEETALDSKGMQ